MREDLRQAGQLRLRHPQRGVVAAVRDIQAARAQCRVSRLEELDRGERTRGCGTREDVADDDIATPRREAEGHRARLPGADLDGGGRRDIEKLTHQLSELGIKLYHGVVRVRPDGSEIARQRAPRAAQVDESATRSQRLDSRSDPAHVLELKLLRFVQHDV